MAISHVEVSIFLRVSEPGLDLQESLLHAPADITDAVERTPAQASVNHPRPGIHKEAFVQVVEVERSGCNHRGVREFRRALRRSRPTIDKLAP